MGKLNLNKFKYLEIKFLEKNHGNDFLMLFSCFDNDEQTLWQIKWHSALLTLSIQDKYFYNFNFC